jgi:HlyD family secretion protein
MATALSRPATALRGRWLTAGIIIIVVAIIAAIAINSMTRPSAASAISTTTVARSQIVATTAGSGTIAAAQSLDVAFATSGTIAEILVSEGDQVRAGEPLARLDTRDLEIQLASAQTQVDSARLKLEQTSAGNATDETIAAQQSGIKSSEAQLASAQAQLRSAQAKLTALRSPSASDIQAAELKVRTAELDLQSVRDSKSTAKSRAQLDLDKAVQSLTQAQSSYSSALQNWQYVQDSGNDPQNPTKTEGTKTVDNKLNDAQRQSYYDKFVQAEAALKSAEAAVQQSQLSFDQARQDEAISIQQYEVKLADAQRALSALRSPSKSDLVTQQASVDQAQASVAQAQANLEQAQTNLTKLTAPSTQSDIAIQRASVSQAEQSLAQARLKLEQATLIAPFDAIVTDVNLVTGSIASSATPAFSLIDRSTLHVDLKLSENDVAAIQIGQPVALTIDALKGWKNQGAVGYIAPSAEESNGVVTYRVRVDFNDSDQRVKVGMTANLTITTATIDQALVVPNTALLPDGAGRVVQVPNADGTTRNIPVEIGLTDGVSTEIVSGLGEGDVVVTAPGAKPQAAPGFGG